MTKYKKATKVSMSPGEWNTRLFYGPPQTEVIKICCSTCGRSYTLPPQNGVEADGKVSGVVTCPHHDCGSEYNGKTGKPFSGEVHLDGFGKAAPKDK